MSGITWNGNMPNTRGYSSQYAQRVKETFADAADKISGPVNQRFNTDAINNERVQNANAQPWGVSGGSVELFIENKAKDLGFGNKGKIDGEA